MALRSILFLLAILTASCGEKQDYVRVGSIWKDCSKSNDKATIKSIDFIPDPPKRGHDVTVNATVILSEEVTSGKIKVHAKYSFITLVDTTLDLCTIARETGKPCPLQPGVQYLTVTETIPSITPGGQYTGSAVATDQDGNELACIDLNMHI